MAHEPIDPQDYTFGVNVVDIGDLRVARGKTRRPLTTCKHKNLSYDAQERRVYCHDCERDVDPFDAFVGLCIVWDAASKQLKAKQQHMEEVRTYEARSLAVKALDKSWSRRTLVPACPHCKEGLLPEDFKDGVKMEVSADLTRAKRNRGKK